MTDIIAELVAGMSLGEKRGLFEALRAEWEALPASAAEARKGLALADALHDRIKAFLCPFYGVSSKWLRHYLWWFLYVGQFAGGDAKREERLAADQVGGALRAHEAGGDRGAPALLGLLGGGRAGGDIRDGYVCSCQSWSNSENFESNEKYEEMCAVTHFKA